jgi:hypothetical protein
MLDALAFSWGTPSKNVVTAGLAGLDPTPRNRALLSLRAVNSVKTVFGTVMAASDTMATPARASISAVIAVRLRGSFCALAGSFWAVTMTSGRTTCGVGAWAAAPRGIPAKARLTQAMNVFGAIP